MKKLSGLCPICLLCQEPSFEIYRIDVCGYKYKISQENMNFEME